LITPAAHNRGRVLVTGAAGFLGRHLVDGLLAEGWEVLALVHRRRLAVRPDSTPVRLLEGDINDPSVIRAAVSGASAVCHLAAYIPPNHADPTYAEPCLRTNALSTLHLAQAVLDHPGCTFLYLSSSNAYAPGADNASEEDALYPADRATYYLASKLLGELYVEHLRRTCRLRAVTLRVSTTYGWGMARGSVVSQFMERARQGLPLTVRDGGVPTYDFVYARDVVRVALAALRETRPGVYNVGSGTAHSLLDLAGAVANTFPEHGARIDVEPPVGPIPASFRAVSIQKAAATWGYKPASLREGLADYRRQMERLPGDCCDTE
jgi:nucleoside-diphosphate-sugar epimerase